MFYGVYKHQIDDKGRLRLPAKLRGELGGSFFCVKGYDNTVLIMSKTRFEEVCEQYSTLSMSDINAQRAFVELVSTATLVEEDSQGRFLLSQCLKDYAKIEKNVVIKGVFNRIEIWSETSHEERSSNKTLNELAIDLGTGVI